MHALTRTIGRHRPRLRDVVAILGALLAGYGQLRLATAEPSVGLPRQGMVLLVLGAAIFALASTHRVGASTLAHGPACPVGLRGVFRAGLARSAAVGGLAVFAALLARLALGSTAGGDLVLWAAALGLLAIPFALCDRPLLGQVRVGQWLRAYWLDAVALALLGGVVLWANLSDVDAWYYSVIGDEYAFYDGARAILERGVSRPFSQDGVYATHPVLNSVYQAAVMAVFGVDRAGWTGATMLSILVAMVGIYLLGAMLATRVVALVAALTFACSHYLFAFAHIGYNSLDALPPAVWTVALYVLARRTGSALTLFAAGVVGGLGFYTFYSARIMLPILGLFVLTLRERRARIVELWPLALGFAVAVGPIAVVAKADLLLKMVTQVPGGYSASVTGAAVERILTNARNNLPAFNFSSTVQHYVSGSLLDPISALAAALGTALAIWLVRHEAYRLLLLWLGVSIAATGLLSPYPGVAVTRLHFCLPPLVLLGGLATVQLWRTLTDGWAGAPPDGRASAPRRELAEALSVVLALAVLWLNLDRFRVETPRRIHLNQEAVAVGALSHPTCGSGDPRNVIIARNAAPSLLPALTSTRPAGALPRLIDQDTIPANQSVPVDGIRCVIFTEADDPPSRRVLDDLQRRFPAGQVYSFADRADKGRVAVFALPR